MEQVEEICQHIVLIDQGRVILDDTVQNAKRQFKKNRYSITTSNPSDIVEKSNLFKLIERTESNVSLELSPNTNSTDVLRELISQNIQIERFEEEMPSLNNIFIQLVQNHHNSN